MKRTVKRYLLIFSIFAVAILGSFGLSKMKPPPEVKDTADVEILVEVMSLERTTADFTIASQGTVRPRTETIVSAEVAGTIVRVSPSLLPVAYLLPVKNCYASIQPTMTFALISRMHWFNSGRSNMTAP